MPSPRAKKSIHIKVEPRDVYDFAVGDLESLADWLSSVDEVTSADEDWPAVGSSHVYTRTTSGRTVTGTTRIVEADPPRRIVFSEVLAAEGESKNGKKDGEAAPARRSGRSIWTFEPEGSGTRMTMELQGAELSWPLWVLWKLFFDKTTATSVERSLANLKQICEHELEDIPLA